MEKKYAGRVELVYPAQCVQRIFHDHARNGIVEEFLATDCDILWFIDSDVAPPTDALDIVANYSDIWDLAGLPYPVFMTPPGGKEACAIVCVYEDDGIGLKASRIPPKGLKFVDGLATGCLFIKRHVLEGMERPWFEFEYDPITRGMRVGEDLGFCLKVAEHGYRFLTDFGKVCAHYKRINLLQVVNYATAHAQSYVDTYHEQIRPIMEGLAKQVEQLKREKASRIETVPFDLDRAKKKLLNDFSQRK